MKITFTVPQAVFDAINSGQDITIVLNTDTPIPVPTPLPPAPPVDDRIVWLDNLSDEAAVEPPEATDDGRVGIYNTRYRHLPPELIGARHLYSRQEALSF